MESNPNLDGPKPTSMDISKLAHVTGMSDESVLNWFSVLKQHTKELTEGVFEPKTAFDCLLATRRNLSLIKANLEACPAVLVCKVWVPVTVSDTTTYTYEAESGSSSTASSTSASSNDSNDTSSSKDTSLSSISTSSDGESSGSNSASESPTSGDDESLVPSADAMKQQVELLTAEAEAQEWENLLLKRNSAESFSFSQQSSLYATPAKANMGAFITKMLDENGNETAAPFHSRAKHEDDSPNGHQFKLLLAECDVSPLSFDGDNDDGAE
jgi:hypothetical protein